MRRRSLLLAAVAVLASPRARATGIVRVLYAGSLVNLMEHGVGAAFDLTGDDRFQGYAGGSNKLAHDIQGQLRRADVFVSANPRVNDTLSGAANGDWVRWYVAFAQSPLVLGCLPSTPTAAAFASKPWYEALQQPGLRIGRTDPKLDPKGKLTLDLMARAAQVYKLPGLGERVLGADDNPAQVFPEEALVGRLQSGQLDVGFFYSTETTDLKLDAIKLPPEVALSAHYTATVVRDAANPAGAERFVAFLLSAAGRELMRQHGLDPVPPAVGGAAAALPASLRAVLPAAK